MKQYDITDAKGAAANITDLKRWGDPDMWKLLAKASSDEGKWMKSTKAMEIPGIGCVIQVTTQQGDQVAEALTFVPFASIIETVDGNGDVYERRLAMPSMPHMEGMAEVNGVYDV